MQNKRRRTARGFTLLEVLMVIVIIGVLIAAVVPNLMGTVSGAREDTTRNMIKSGLSGSLETFFAHMGRYPTTEEGLTVLYQKPNDEEVAQNWRGPYIKNPEDLKDAWKREFRYRSPGEFNEDGFDLSSAGKNGQHGDEDDITNWKRT